MKRQTIKVENLQEQLKELESLYLSRQEKSDNPNYFVGAIAALRAVNTEIEKLR